MHLSDIDLRGFEFREGLKNITRYSLYETMFYRPDDFFHTTKVFHLLNATADHIKKVYGERVDVYKTVVMGLVHDDAELLTGDIQAGHKKKMSTETLQSIENAEQLAIHQIATQAPSHIYGYNYQDLLLEVMHKNTLESQLVKYIDHIDAYCEALHEIGAGNESFATNTHHEQLGKIDTPFQYYMERFNDHEHKYPLIGEIFGDTIPFLHRHHFPDTASILAKAKLYTADSRGDTIDNPVYQRRKSVLQNAMSPEELSHLYVQKEG